MKQGRNESRCDAAGFVCFRCFGFIHQAFDIKLSEQGFVRIRLSPNKGRVLICGLELEPL
jgi:hypothetical protein